MSSVRHPARAQTVKRAEHLLSHGLDRHRVDVFVAARFQNALGVGAVRLVAPNVGAHLVRRQ
jgi:hypothetical protein